jgi:hypothetical protein
MSDAGDEEQAIEDDSLCDDCGEYYCENEQYVGCKFVTCERWRHEECLSDDDNEDGEDGERTYTCSDCHDNWRDGRRVTIRVYAHKSVINLIIEQGLPGGV